METVDREERLEYKLLVKTKLVKADGANTKYFNFVL